MNENYKQFVDKINTYIKKFYFYQLLRGLILFILLLVFYFSSVTGLEYLNYFNPNIKLIIIILTLFFTLVIFIYFLLLPLIKLIGFGKRLSYYDVSTLLNQAFPEIKDRLVNIIELVNESNQLYSNELLQASINQKIDELSIFRFSDAIRFRDLKVIISLLFGVLIIFSFVFLKFPDFFTESSIRLVHFQEKFEKPAPYVFHLENDHLEIVTGESVELVLNCIGKSIPEMMYVNVSGNNFLMSKSGNNFKYTIENVNASISIFFTDRRYYSDIYRIKVLNKPFISSFDVEVCPPSYTDLQGDKFKNIGDLKVSSGSIIKWRFKTVDTDSLMIVFDDSTRIHSKKIDDFYEVERSVFKDVGYQIIIKNSKLSDTNNLVYKIQVVSDLFPEIKVVQVRDTLDFRIFHFKGTIIDDYGFNQLIFNINSDGKDSLIHIPFISSNKNQDFYYSFNFESVRSLGKSFKYYFAVTDNDVFNHYKRSVSETFTFIFPEYVDVLNKEVSDQKSIDHLFQKSMKLTEEIQQEFKDLKMKQINTVLSDWEKFQSVKDIIKKKNELENVLHQIDKQHRESGNFLNSLFEKKEDIIKKQQQLDELFKDVFTDDLKKLFNEFNELAKQFDSKKFDQLYKQMDFNLNDLSKQLDRNMQLLKRMKVEQKVERVISELKRLSEEENNTLQTFKLRFDQDQLGLKVKENQTLINNLKIDYNSAIELNKLLEKPLNLYDFDKEFKVLNSNYSTIFNELPKANKRKMSSLFENNIKDIVNLLFAMDQMLKNNKRSESYENEEDIKQILNNLILLSFDQEKLLRLFSSVDYNNPLLNKFKVEQKNLQGQIELIGDSLLALSKRSPEISSVVGKELTSLRSNAVSAFDNVDIGNIVASRMYQQYVITASNNLSLFLSEALENIKNQRNNSKEGNGDCDKPGGKGSKPSLKNLKDGQNSIKDQLQKMIDMMKNGNLGQMDKSIAQTLAQQEIMQQLIREMLGSSSVGSKTKDQLKVMDQLIEQSRLDLINKNINNELINRQNLILSKLLDAEKSEIERDFDDKRESKTAIDTKLGNSEGYFEYRNELKNESELLKHSNYKLKSFYDQKYNGFLNQFK